MVVQGAFTDFLLKFFAPLQEEDPEKKVVLNFIGNLILLSRLRYLCTSTLISFYQ